jgi:hypothetical protein
MAPTNYFYIKGEDDNVQNEVLILGHAQCGWFI